MTDDDARRPDGEAGPPRAGSEPDPPRRSRRSPLGVVWEWTRSIVVAFVLFLVLRSFVVEAFKIPTSSMERTLLVGDFLLVNKAVYGSEVPGSELRLPGVEEPGRGDIVVFHPPHDPVRNYVKRVVGVPGDTLEMRDKTLFVNGTHREEPYARHLDRSGDAVHPAMRWQRSYLVSEVHASHGEYRPSRDNWGPLVVPDRRYFVLGDNRDNSEDSRYWGFVDREAIRGRPLFIYYSYAGGEDRELGWLGRVRWKRLGSAIE